MYKVTKIEIQKNNKDRVNVYLEDEYGFSCATELIYVNNIKINEYIDRENIEKLAKKDDYIKAKNLALKYIEKSYKTEKEIIDKLKLKGYEDEICRGIIEFLKEYNFINDDNFTRIYIKEKSTNFGANKIKYNLGKRGISKDIINKYLAIVDSEEQQSIAFDVALKKYNQIIKKDTDIKKVYQKLLQFLISKGYEWDLAYEVVKKITNGNHEFIT